ncbi:MAG: hypothetical protein ACE5PO_01590 [Candidatus Bathyarchaeia archaeon]
MTGPHDVFSRNILTGTFAVTFIVVKMVGLESLRFDVYPFEVKIVAVLLPLAMVFGWYGIAGMTIGCTAAHTVSFHGYLDLSSAALAAFVGSVISYALFKKHPNSLGLLAGTLIITAVWTVTFGAYQAYVTDVPLLTGLFSMLSTLWIAVNVIGYLAAGACRALVHT